MNNREMKESLYGYLFVHFIGEKEDCGEQIYFALSRDGMHWQDLNQSQPVLRSTVGERGVRDPYLLRSADGSRFYLLATDLSIYHRGGWASAEATVTGSRSLVIWESPDLVNWSEPRLVEAAPEEGGCAWAPEAICDEEEGDYLVFWASSRACDGDGRGLHIYCSKTQDFRTFTPAELYITRGENSVIIDTTIIKAGDKYFRASGDGQITIETSDRLMGEWKVVSTLESLGLELTGKDVEGPEFFQFNGEEKWGLLVDQYSTGRGYLPILTTDIGDSTGVCWRKLETDEYDFGGLKKRHGSILPITKTEYEAILTKWGDSQ